jgi:hypothetical protein
VMTRLVSLELISSLKERARPKSAILSTPCLGACVVHARVWQQQAHAGRGTAQVVVFEVVLCRGVHACARGPALHSRAMSHDNSSRRQAAQAHTAVAHTTLTC